MSAPVRIEAEAWSDLRFATLARILGLGAADYALIRTARIWSWQAEHYTPEAPTYVVDLDTIESALGAGGAAALVRARLADETPDGYRIRGARGRIEWLWQKRQAARAGGEATKRKHGNKPGPHGPPPGEPAAGLMPSPLVPAPDLVPEDPELSPACAIPPSPDPAPVSTPAVAQAAGGREQDPPPREQDPADREREARRCVQLELRAELERERAAVAAELGTVDRGLLAQDPGERDLAMHLVAAGPNGLAAAREQALHAIAMAGLEARRDRSLQWLTGAIFGERNFRRLVATTAAEAKRARPSKSGAKSETTTAPAPTKRETAAPILVSAAELEDVARLAAEARATLFGASDGARAPPASARPSDTDDEQPQPRTAT